MSRHAESTQVSDGCEVRSIAVVGVGMMGRPIAHRLISAGYDVIVCDSEQARLTEFAEVGAITTTEVATCSRVDAVLVLVNTISQVREVLDGPGGLLARVDQKRPPLIVVMSTIARKDLVELANVADERGSLLVDAPVSGGDTRAALGTLTVMAGGPSEGIDRIRPVLDCLATNVFHCGPLGSGATVKVLNNVINTLNSIAMAEILRLARNAAIGPDRVAEVFEVSTGRNMLTKDPVGTTAYYERFTATRELWGSMVALLKKDAEAARSLADADGGTYPVISGLTELLETLGEESYDNWSAAGRIRRQR